MSENEYETWIDLSRNIPGQNILHKADLLKRQSINESVIRYYLDRFNDKKTKERSYRIGANGEVFVGSQLNSLRESGWHVLHSIPSGKRYADIDHLLIGPGGVWTVNTKHHPNAHIRVSRNQIHVNGRPYKYIQFSENEATRVSKLFSEKLNTQIPVKPAIVILNDEAIPNFHYYSLPENVVVLSSLDFLQFFQKLGSVMSDELLGSIFNIARRSTTWKPLHSI
jgi:hypothetical protein